MPDLIAQGPRRQNRWRRRIPAGETVTLGRDAGAWSVHWDNHVSRQHLKLHWDEQTLHVEALSRSGNPTFFQGAEVQTFRLKTGEHFVVGNTTFTLTVESASIGMMTAPPVTEQTFSQEYLRRLSFRDPGRRLELLSRLPERLATANDESVYESAVRVVFDGIRQANAVALCKQTNEESEIEFLHWDRGREWSGSMNPSHRLISEAVKKCESIVHIWDVQGENAAFTENDGMDWAFCTPFSGAACRGWALFVAGSAHHRNPSMPSRSTDLQDEMKFAEVVVSTVGSFCEVRSLQKRQSALSQFFSPPVVTALADDDPDDTLAPREIDVTVLFCDLRGFSLEMERSAGDLLGLLKRVSNALGVLTHVILAEGGVIGDFHGDAAMGFWGWPLPQRDAATRAARAALAIRRDFSEVASLSNHSLSNFQIGIGIASGRAVAGKIGTTDQVKVTAFGPAVNLASRLEGMTKQLNTPILTDEKTANRLRGAVDIRLRRLALVQPYGMESAIEINELLPSEDEYPLLSQEHIDHYESALVAFQAGDWSTAWKQLHSVPVADPSKDFLTTFLASRGHVVPAGWDGIIRLDSK